MAYEYESNDTVAGKSLDFEYSGDAVTAESTEYRKWADQSKLVRALLGGTAAMKSAGTEFLVKHPLESDTAYRLRLEQSVLFNIFVKTAGFLAGQVFQADIVWSENVPDDFKELMKKCDAKENDINVFAKRVFALGIALGCSHILVDAPRVKTEMGRPLSLLEERQMGIRPYLRFIHPMDVIGWIIDEAGRLQQIRFREIVPVRQGRYGFDTERRIRVYNANGSWELWLDRKGTDDVAGEATLIDEGQLSYEGIPLVPFIPGEEMSILTGKSPLQDLAELNLTHWRSFSDQRNILSVARVPILFGRHIKVEQMPVGVSAMVVSEEDNSDIRYVEISGAAIDKGQQDIEKLEERMALWGLQQLIPRSGNMTATEKALTSRETNSALGTWATEFEKTLQQVFEVFQAMRGQEFPSEGLTLNKEYNLGVVNSEEGNLLLSMKDKGVLSGQAAFDEFRRRGLIDESLSWDDIQADKEQDLRLMPNTFYRFSQDQQQNNDQNTDE